MTERGGRREGAGRPKGATNRLSKASIEQAIASGGEMPLDYLLRGMRGEPIDEVEVEIDGKSQTVMRPLPVRDRLRLAIALLAYFHHRLSPIDHQVPASGSLPPDKPASAFLPDFELPADFKSGNRR
jgi:hypothetical protein